jgi:hypothetical protein
MLSGMLATGSRKIVVNALDGPGFWDKAEVTENPTRHEMLTRLKEKGMQRMAIYPNGNVMVAHGHQMIHNDLVNQAEKHFGQRGWSVPAAFVNEGDGPKIATGSHMHRREAMKHPHIKKLGFPISTDGWDDVDLEGGM